MACITWHAYGQDTNVLFTLRNLRLPAYKLAIVLMARITSSCCCQANKLLAKDSVES